MSVKLNVGFAAICGCLIAVMLASCGSRQDYIGTYEAVREAGCACELAIVDLRDNGEGVWKCNHEEVAFTWHVKDGEIRIHTREGGIMTGKLTDDGFSLIMPLDTELRFEKKSAITN